MPSVLWTETWQCKSQVPTSSGTISAEELLPSRLPATFRGWLDAMSSQNVGNRIVCQQMSEIGKCALNPAITPTSIFLCHSRDERRDLSGGSWPSGSALGAAIVFLGDQLSVPSQQCLRSH